MSTLWCCPLCREPLQRQGNSLQCAAGHCFDYAREGYVNLLPAQRKRSREPGDSRAMIDARRRVHGARLYQPLVDAIVAALRPLLVEGDSLLDLGCGEGYYSQGLLSASLPIDLFGLDIAKAAVRLAAKACPAGEFAVASAFDVPLPARSMSAIVSVFAPVSDAELARLLKPGGHYLKVAPGANHLWELRQLLYSSPRPHEQSQACPIGLEVIARNPVTFTLHLRGQLLQDLVAMTPYAYGGQRENKARLDELDALQCQADFALTLCRRSE